MSADDERHNHEALMHLGVMLNDMFVGCATEALRSVVEGSELTGSAGQPVDTGYLKGSFQLTFPSADHAQIGTNAAYAEAIEHGTGRFGPLTLRSPVGGFHSIAMTVSNFDRIITHERARVTNARQ